MLFYFDLYTITFNYIAVSKQEQTKENIVSLVSMLESKDGMLRKKARESLVKIGKPAVSTLISTFRNSKVDQVRWEAIKALGAIVDPKAIPVMVKALEDDYKDVAWLAAVGLIKLKMAAWPALLRALIKRGPDSLMLRQGAHHILHEQRGGKHSELLEVLLNALESETAEESSPPAAYNLLAEIN